jgi:hypothetical protein
VSPDGQGFVFIADSNLPTLGAQQTSPLFTIPEMTLQPLALAHRYAVRADGQHFLVAPAPNQANLQEVSVDDKIGIRDK